MPPRERCYNYTFVPSSFACSDDYSSGYSDGGGGQDRGDKLVCDLADSDDGGGNNMVCDIADAESDGGVGVDVGSWSAAGSRSWHQEGSACEPEGLEAALAKAKAATGNSSRVASTTPPEDVIDLLSGDEGQGGGVVDISPDSPSPPPRPPSPQPTKATSELDGLANDEPAGVSDLAVVAKGDAARPDVG